ncbi:MAG: BMP family lipoprotein [Bacilli bacterium]
MKKIKNVGFVAFAALGLVAGLTSCGPKNYEIALITDLGDIDDQSFNQGAWEGVKAYAKEHGISHQYYKPGGQSTTEYVEMIDLAVNNGAKVVVTPGYLFEEPIFICQDKYPDVHFILLDGEPHSGDYSEFKTNANVQPILYAEEQSGYLAGYAAVKDGYRKLAFMGGMAVPAVKRFGLGYLIGIDDAATELGLTEIIPVKYHYTGNFKASLEALSKAETWYQSGSEIIFACGGAVGLSVMQAAEGKNGKVIGVDVDQGHMSDTVITSAVKGLAASVIQALTAHYDGTWEGGTTWNLDASKDGVGLPTKEESWKFETFTLAEYQAVFAKLVDGTVDVAARLPENYLVEGDTDEEKAANAKATVEALDEVLTKITVTYEA